LIRSPQIDLQPRAPARPPRGRSRRVLESAAYKDKAGRWLDGGTSYRLRVPPDPPARLFWSVTVYDVDRARSS
jgi:hypothetical protein